MAFPLFLLSHFSRPFRIFWRSLSFGIKALINLLHVGSCFHSLKLLISLNPRFHSALQMNASILQNQLSIARAHLYPRKLQYVEMKARILLIETQHLLILIYKRSSVVFWVCGFFKLDKCRYPGDITGIKTFKIAIPMFCLAVWRTLPSKLSLVIYIHRLYRCSILER